MRLLAIWSLLGCAVYVSHQTNAVLVISDDQGWGDLGVHGNTNLSTSNIDSFATDGALFTRVFVSPVCAPTRASLLTGRYFSRISVAGVTRGRERMNLDEVTFAQLFQSAGYQTGVFGKWHNGSQYPYHPNGRGLSEFVGFCCGHWGHYCDPHMEHNGRPIQWRGCISDVFTDAALLFIETTKIGHSFAAWPTILHIRRFNCQIATWIYLLKKNYG